MKKRIIQKRLISTQVQTILEVLAKAKETQMTVESRPENPPALPACLVKSGLVIDCLHCLYCAFASMDQAGADNVYGMYFNFS